MRAGLLLFVLASASVIACTFIVDGEFKDFGSTCQLSGLTTTDCGKCLSSKCQSKIDAVCTSTSLTSNVSECAQNPAPGRNWNCNNLMGDAALHLQNPAPGQDALNQCSALCVDDCTKCTTIDAGTGDCGKCIMDKCGALLNGNGGCCDDTTVAEGIASCTAPAHPNCMQFRDTVDSVSDSGKDGMPPVYESCKQSSSQEFAKCVIDNCGMTCP